jgi:hypothetical protein
VVLVVLVEQVLQEQVENQGLQAHLGKVEHLGKADLQELQGKMGKVGLQEQVVKVYQVLLVHQALDHQGLQDQMVILVLQGQVGNQGQTVNQVLQELLVFQV